MSILKKHPAIFMGMLITIIFLGLGLFRMKFLDSLELAFYDLRMNLITDSGSQSEIVMVDIDNDSIEKLGRWPWPRSLIAEGIDKINQGSPKVIGLNIILSEPEENSGVKEIKNLKKLFTKTVSGQAGDTGVKFVQAIDNSILKLDNDGKLADSLKKSGKVVLPVFFKESIVVQDEITETNTALAKQSIQDVSSYEDFQCPAAGEILLPINSFFNAAEGIGHINFVADMDGTVRREILLYEYQGLYIPSYTLKLASLYLNVPLDKIRAELGSTVYLNSLEIPTTSYSELLVSFKGSRGSFKNYSFFDVIHDKIPLSIFKNKIVLVSASASGIMNPISTPTDQAMSVGEFSANTIRTILHKKFIQEPFWGHAAELAVLLISGLIITFVLPRLKAMVAFLAFVVILIFLAGGSTYLFVAKNIWVQTTYPLIEIIFGYIGVLSLNYFVTETRKDKVEGESAETNRQLGISFQSQGMLDMAFDKLRRVPVDEEMKDILYNLGLDFERKRQFTKAAAVYEYIEKNDSEFKDVGKRKKKLMQAGETMVYGNAFPGRGSADDDLLATGTDIRPTLGRYEIIRQLGKGAMGIVYLGKDPRINRTTAIKTFKFAEDFEPEEVQKMKEKIFREAESAGTLSHPNIVTIYDAGDEQDLAYIAMEFLEGEDLEKYTKKDNLLPMRKVIDYAADIADGLDYAHQQGIVHRDIKPANIMLLKNGVIKITDFGIARITASSRAQTGVVKGTPYYMAPEQISGEKVDGRADIFSLGTMLFQLLTGRVPFYGDSPAALMRRIMNVPHPDPKKLNPKIVTPLKAIINKALEKNKKKRYQKASQMSDHLRKLAKNLDAAVFQKKMLKKGQKNNTKVQG